VENQKSRASVIFLSLFHIAELSKSLMKKGQRRRANFGRFLKFSSTQAGRKQNVSYYKPVAFNELKFSCLPYNRHLINRARSQYYLEAINSNPTLGFFSESIQIYFLI